MILLLLLHLFFRDVSLLMKCFAVLFFALSSDIWDELRIKKIPNLIW